MATSLSTVAVCLSVDTRTQAKSITLPLAASYPGKIFVFKDSYGLSGTNNITIFTTSPNLIDNTLTYYTINSYFAGIRLISDGINGWWVIGNNGGSLFA